MHAVTHRVRRLHLQSASRTRLGQSTGIKRVTARETHQDVAVVYVKARCRHVVEHLWSEAEKNRESVVIVYIANLLLLSTVLYA